MSVRAQALASAGLAVAALLPGCGSDRPSTGLVGGPSAQQVAALASVEKLPDPLRLELLKACDKWSHLDRPCDEEGVRRDLLDCWAEKGERIYAWTGGRGMRPRARYLRTLLEVNLCMELKRWRKLLPGPEFTSREE